MSEYLVSKEERCIAVCAHVPSARAMQAGHKVAYHFIKTLASEKIVDLLLLANAAETVEPDLRNELGVRNLVVHTYGRLEKLISIALGIGRVPPRYASRYSPPAVKLFKKMVSSESYELAYFEFSQVAPFVNLVSSKAILSMHDVQTQVVLRSSLLERLAFSSATFKYEEALLRKFSKIYVLCQKDSHLLRGLYGHLPVSVRPPEISEFVSKVNRCGQEERYSMLFWGAMNRPENEQAALYFAKTVLPSILARFPEAKFYIVGNAPSRRLLSLQSKNVIVTGYIADPVSFFERAALGVVPLLRGAGVKIKTLEMLSAGLPVLSTPVGAEGVQGCEHLKISEVEAFSELILAYFEGP